jgi:hypothetical protein
VATSSIGRRVWVLWALVLALLSATVALWLVNNTVRPQSSSPLPLAVPGFATVGAILVARHRGHVVGWLFLGLAAVTALGSFSEAYAIRAYLTGTLPVGAYLIWLTTWLSGLFVLPLGLLLLLFPTGRLPSGRWRPVVWVLVVSTAYLVGKFMLTPVLGLQVSQTEHIGIAKPCHELPSGQHRHPAVLGGGAQQLCGIGHGSISAVGTLPATTPPRPWRRSAPACGMRSTWTPSPPSSWPWSTRRPSRHRRHCGPASRGQAPGGGA